MSMMLVTEKEAVATEVAPITFKKTVKPLPKVLVN